MGMNMGEAYLNVPLLNPKAYGQIDSSKAQYSKDYYAYEQTVRKALRDVENDLSAHRLYAKRYDDFAHANLSLQQGCNNEILQFQNGLSNYTTVLECQIGLQQSQIALTQSKLDKLLAIVALYQDLGGGYAVESTESSKQKQ
jgi:outer membrane protein TolC